MSFSFSLSCVVLLNDSYFAQKTTYVALYIIKRNLSLKNKEGFDEFFLKSEILEKLKKGLTVFYLANSGVGKGNENDHNSYNCDRTQ